MRKMFGTKAVVSLILILRFSMCLTTKAASDEPKGTPVSIPYLNIREADQDGLFLLVFDVSGSVWSEDREDLAGDFKTIYLYLSGCQWAVEHDVILFDEEARLRSEILKKKQEGESEDEWIEEVWATKKDTDLKDAFERINNYLGGVFDKSWIHFVMVSDFYDSFKDDESESRKNRMDEIVTSFDKDHDWELYQDYFVFDSLMEESQGNQRYIPYNNANTKSSVHNVQKISESFEEDGYAEVKREFAEKVLQGLTGHNELEWKLMKDISMDDLKKCKDYFVYSDKKMDYSDEYSDNIVWDCSLESGGYLYHVNHIDMKTLGLDRSINKYYILVMPHIDATMIYTMSGNEDDSQERSVETRLEIMDKDKDLVQADSFMAIFTLKKDKEDNVPIKLLKLKKEQNGYVGMRKLKCGVYNVLLRRRTGDVLLDEIVEEGFTVKEK